jgi:hypothetical protein
MGSGGGEPRLGVATTESRNPLVRSSTVQSGSQALTSESQAAIEAAWRIEAPRLIAALTRLVRDVALAEDFAQDALLAALEQWPARGVPRNAGAWLMTAARRRAIDFFRRSRRLDQKQEEIARATAVEQDLRIGNSKPFWRRPPSSASPQQPPSAPRRWPPLAPPSARAPGAPRQPTRAACSKA